MRMALDLGKEVPRKFGIEEIKSFSEIGSTLSYSDFKIFNKSDKISSFLMGSL